MFIKYVSYLNIWKEDKETSDKEDYKLKEEKGADDETTKNTIYVALPKLIVRIHNGSWKKDGLCEMVVYGDFEQLSDKEGNW